MIKASKKSIKSDAAIHGCAIKTVPKSFKNFTEKIFRANPSLFWKS